MERKIKISVVMTTYNGEKYIREQIESIVHQTTRPDEILIFDDVSTDGTQEILNYYERRYDNVKVIINDINKGWRANFAYAISQSKGDFIFLSDQDDIWFHDKIEKMVGIMQKNDSIELLASNYEPIYESAHIPKVNGYFYRKYGLKYLVKIKRPKLLCVAFRPGCSYCFKRSMISLFEDLWSDDCPHDLVLWEIAAFRGSLYIVNEQLFFFRRHMENNTPQNPHNRVARIEKVTSLLKLVCKIQGLEAMNLDNSHKKNLKNLENYYKNRVELIKHKSIHNGLLVVKYINYYPMLRGFIGDFIAK